MPHYLPVSAFTKFLFVSSFFLNKYPGKKFFFPEFKYMFKLSKVLNKFWKIKGNFVTNWKIDTK